MAPKAARHGTDAGKGEGHTYSDLEIHKLLRERAHLVIEAESILSRLQRREHEVALALLLAVQDDLVVRARHLVVDIEGASCLDLHIAHHNQH